MSIYATQWPVWPEAEILREPVRGNASEPEVIVRRRQSGLVGPNGEDIGVFGGLPHISLFAGIDGFSLGMEWSGGYETVLQHEMSEMCCHTLLANRPGHFRSAALIQGDIFKTPTSMILEESGLMVGECRVVTGGPPCQGFSWANSNRGNGHDKRNDCILEFVRKVDEIKPWFFIFENVPEFLQLNKGEYFESFLEVAYNSYYELVYGLIDCCEYGVPQRRVRFICMGTRRDVAEVKGQIAGLPAPEHFGKSDLRILRAADRRPEKYPEAASIRRAPGIRYFPDRPVLVPPSPAYHGGHGDDNHEFDGRPKSFLKFYDRLAKEEPDRLVEIGKEAA